MEIEKVTEQQWRLFELIGLDIKTRDIATMFGCGVPKVWRLRQNLSRKLGFKGPRLVVTAVRCVWCQEHDPEHPHIATVFKKLVNQKK